MELSASRRDKPSFRNKQRMALDDAFKEPEHLFRIAIICAKHWRHLPARNRAVKVEQLILPS